MHAVTAPVPVPVTAVQYLLLLLTTMASSQLVFQGLRGTWKFHRVITHHTANTVYSVNGIAKWSTVPTYVNKHTTATTTTATATASSKHDTNKHIDINTTHTQLPSNSRRDSRSVDVDDNTFDLSTSMNRLYYYEDGEMIIPMMPKQRIRQSYMYTLEKSKHQQTEQQTTAMARSYTPTTTTAPSSMMECRDDSLLMNIYFADREPRLFQSLEFTKSIVDTDYVDENNQDVKHIIYKSSDTHYCTPDTYIGEYVYNERSDSLHVRYDVKGPSKDYESVTQYYKIDENG
jgi:hypothetical protein